MSDEFVELKTCLESRKGELALTSDTGSNATNGLTTLSNIEPLLCWIPAFAGMTMPALLNTTRKNFTGQALASPFLDSLYDANTL